MATSTAMPSSSSAIRDDSPEVMKFTYRGRSPVRNRFVLNGRGTGSNRDRMAGPACRVYSSRSRLVSVWAIGNLAEQRPAHGHASGRADDISRRVQLCSIPYGRRWLPADNPGSGIVAASVRHRTDASPGNWLRLSLTTLGGLRRPGSIAEVVASPNQGLYRMCNCKLLCFGRDAQLVESRVSG